MTDIIEIEPYEDNKELMMIESTTKISHLRDVCKIFMNLIKKKDDERTVILDVGCRDNKLEAFFSQLGYIWTGVDAYSNHSSIIRTVMEDMPFPNESFSVVFCSHALEHSENIVQAIKEMARVTKVGGHLFIATPHPCNYQIFECDKTHILVPTADQMIRLFQHLGIQPLHVHTYNVKGQEERFANLISIGKVVR